MEKLHDIAQYVPVIIAVASALCATLPQGSTASKTFNIARAVLEAIALNVGNAKPKK